MSEQMSAWSGEVFVDDAGLITKWDEGASELLGGLLEVGLELDAVLSPTGREALQRGIEAEKASLLGPVSQTSTGEVIGSYWPLPSGGALRLVCSDLSWARLSAGTEGDLPGLRLARGMAHEVNNALQLVFGALQCASRGQLSECMPLLTRAAERARRAVEERRLGFRGCDVAQSEESLGKVLKVFVALVGDVFRVRPWVKWSRRSGRICVNISILNQSLMWLYREARKSQEFPLIEVTGEGDWAWVVIGEAKGAWRAVSIDPVVDALAFREGCHIERAGEGYRLGFAIQGVDESLDDAEMTAVVVSARGEGGESVEGLEALGGDVLSATPRTLRSLLEDYHEELSFVLVEGEDLDEMELARVEAMAGRYSLTVIATRHQPGLSARVRTVDSADSLSLLVQSVLFNL